MSKKEIDIDIQSDGEENEVKITVDGAEVPVDEATEESAEEVEVEVLEEEEPSELDLLKEQSEKLQNDVAEMKDKLLRTMAEMDNIRRRTAKEKLELSKTAGKEVIVDLLPVLDDFERAFKADPENELNKGFELIYQKLWKNLEGRGLEKMDTVGQSFDPDLHAALTEIPAPNDDMKGKIIDEIEGGYMLKGKIIRHPKVVVGK